MYALLFHLFVWHIASAGGHPPIQSILKPAVYQKMINDREVMTHATIEDDLYSFYATVLIRSSIRHTRSVLTDYQVYKKLIPYIDQVEYNPEKKILKLEGGIWKFRLQSTVQFTEKSDTWIQFRIIEGHLTGLAGDMFFEPQGEQGTVVYFSGRKTGKEWPPKFVMEKGAEIVFSFTGRKMRSHVEEEKRKSQSPQQKENEKASPESTPQPKSNLRSTS
jgi:hypothetical protein